MATIGYYICYPFAALMRLFYELTASYGVSIILFSLVIKLILLPFQMKSKKSMMRMTRLNGKMQEIQKKYANNRIKMNEEIQKLYEEEGANPASGCLWSFLPMPIMIALYYIIREPIKYFMNFGSLSAGTAVVNAAKEAISAAGLSLSANSAVEQIEIVNTIVQNADKGPIADFLANNPNWVNVQYDFLGVNLSQVPMQHLGELADLSWGIIGLILIPVISALLSLMLSRLNFKDQPQAAATGASNKMLIWMMPLMSLYFGLALPAALGIYWIANSAFSYIQEFILNKFFKKRMEEEEETHQRQVEERRKQRMEEAKRLQEEQRQLSARQQAAAKKKADAARLKNGQRASTTEAGRIGDRPYARGRAFSEDHYRDQNETK